jgi:DNA-binding transcriptional regulator YiaG
MYKSEAIRWAGTKARLARLLGISRQAVGKWPSRKPIPKEREKKIRELMDEA